MESKAETKKAIVKLLPSYGLIVDNSEEFNNDNFNNEEIAVKKMKIRCRVCQSYTMAYLEEIVAHITRHHDEICSANNLITELTQLQPKALTAFQINCLNKVIAGERAALFLKKLNQDDDDEQIDWN